MRKSGQGEVSLQGGKQPGPPRLPPPSTGARKQREILTKQQNSFSILDLNYSPFPSAVSARTYNRELLREPPDPRALTRAWGPRPWAARAGAAPRDAVAARASGDSAHSARTRAQRRARTGRCGAMAAPAADPSRQPRSPGHRPYIAACPAHSSRDRPSGRARGPGGAGIWPGGRGHQGFNPDRPDRAWLPLHSCSGGGDEANGRAFSRR